MDVVVRAGFGVVILAGETQRAVDVLAGGRRADAPEGGAGLPGELAVGVEEVGGRADEVGDDGVEAGVEPRLLGAVVVSGGVVVAGFAAGSRVGRAAFGLGERPETAGFPVPAGDPRRRIVPGDVVLFGEHHAVPGKHDPFDHPAIIGGAIGAIASETLLGDPPAERIIGVPPAPTVGSGHTGQPVVGVPAVAPGPRPRRQPFVLAQCHPALAVVLVANPAGTADQRAGVLPTALRGLVHPVAPVTLCGWGRGGHRPGRLGDVARRVVDVTLGPAGPVDGGDPPHRVEIEPAQAGEHVIDLGDIAVSAVGVVAALQHPRVPRTPGHTGGHGLRQQLVVGIPRLRQHHPGIQAAFDLPARRVVGEAHRPTGGLQRGREVVRVICPDTRRPGRRHPPHPPTQHVERRGHRPAVTGLRQHPAERIPLEHTVRIGVGSAHNPADGVVDKRRHTVRGSCLGHIPKQIAGEPHALPRTVGRRDELPGSVMGIGQHPAVEVGLPHQVPGRIVVVAPDQPGRVGHRDQP